MKHRKTAAQVVSAVIVASLAACSGRLEGRALERLADGGVGSAIAGVELSFIREDGSAVHRVTTDSAGAYLIPLQVGRYYVLAVHPDYEDYSSAPGFAVVSANQTATANLFLRLPVVTTVLIVRHAEKLDPASNSADEPLSPAGGERAETLRNNLLRSGVSAVYATDARRTRDTLGPVAALFGLEIETYSTTGALADEVISQHRGDVVLVAAHSNTVATVANALGAQVPTAVIGDFDNLYVLTAAGNQAGVVNLQYGADSVPDVTKNDAAATVLLLVGNAATASPLGGELLHAARKANVEAIYSAGPNALIEPLATALGLAPSVFGAADVPALVAEILAQHAHRTVMVAGTNDDLRAIVREAGGYPTPVLYGSDTDHLVFVARFASGAARVIPMRF